MSKQNPRGPGGRWMSSRSQHGLNVRALVERFQQLAVDQFASYEELDAHLGCPCRPFVGPARERVRQQHGVSVETIRGKGVRRLRPDEVAVTYGRHGQRRIRSAARRTLNRIEQASTDGAPNDELVRRSNFRAFHGALYQFAGDRQLARVQRLGANTTGTLPPRKVLGLFVEDDED